MTPLSPVSLEKAPAQLPAGTSVEFRYGRKSPWMRGHVRHLGDYAGTSMYALRVDPSDVPSATNGWDWALASQVRRYR